MLFKLDLHLREIANKHPSIAKYTSPYIQNDVIAVLHSVLKSKIADKVKKAENFTIMMDGSSGKCWSKIEGIVARCINENGMIEEHAIDLKEAQDRTAQGLLELLISSLTKLGILLDGIASQCYDGASLMSGKHGGVQKLLSVKCKAFFTFIASVINYT